MLKKWKKSNFAATVNEQWLCWSHKRVQKKKKRIENAKRAFGKRKRTSLTHTKTQPKHQLHHFVIEFQENTFVL